MAALYRSDTIRPNGNRQAEASTPSLREEEEENDAKTIRSIHDVSPDTTLFQFEDFELDLSCLSAPSSPAASTSNLPPDTPSPPPSPQLTRATSFTSFKAPTIVKKPSKKLSMPKFVSLPSSSNNPRGSWPLVKYAGRGTPIDRHRRMEWGGSISEEVGEDGMLFSAVRSTSMDSSSRPSQRSARSVTPEWNYLSPLSSVRSHSPSASESNSHGRSVTSLHEPPPELAPIAIEDEWDSIIQTVLGSNTSGPSSISEKQQVTEAEMATHPQQKRRSVPIVEFPMMSPEQIKQLNTGLEIDLGIDKALDLGLGPRGMNLVNLGLLPSSDSGRETPSMYSQPVTPRASPPLSVHQEEEDEVEQEVELDVPSEHASPTSTKAVDEVSFEPKTETETYPWWRRVLYRLRKMQNVMHHTRRRF